MELYLGIDPGAGGCIAAIDRKGNYVATCNHKETIVDQADFIKDLESSNDILLCCIEKVHSMPKQGVTSVFSFGKSYGQSLGIMAATGIRIEDVTPAKWQKALSCLTGGDKKISKAKAQNLFKGVKVTHANADALLIAEYGRRTFGY